MHGLFCRAEVKAITNESDETKPPRPKPASLIKLVSQSPLSTLSLSLTLPHTLTPPLSAFVYLVWIMSDFLFMLIYVRMYAETPYTCIATFRLIYRYGTIANKVHNIFDLSKVRQIHSIKLQFHKSISHGQIPNSVYY